MPNLSDSFTQVTAIVTSHANPLGTANIIEMLQGQTRVVDEIIVLASGEDIEDLPMPPVVWARQEPDREDWGHEKRAAGVDMATGDLLGFFNSDDWYEPTYIEEMVDAIGEHDIVFCDFKSHLFGGNVVQTSAKHGKCTSGNFLVRTDLAQAVGYNHREYNADWKFIEDLLKEGATWTRLEKVLYKHL